MRIIITAAIKSLKPFYERPTRESRSNALTDLILMRQLQICIATLVLVLLLTGCGSETAEPRMSTSVSDAVATATEVRTATPEPVPTDEPVVAAAPERDLDIVTLLPFDQIPSIDNPHFFPDLETANLYYNDGELVLGVEIDGDARAYSVPLLSSHEIVNDVVGGKPIAVTW